MSRQEEIQMLRYFWEEKGDIERYTGWEDSLPMFPRVEKAWKKYLKAKEKLSRVLLETASDIEELQ